MHIEMTLREVWKARKRIQASLPPTPLLYSKALRTLTGVPVYLKLEQLQATGSFKLRGATNMIAALTDAEKQQGVATFSTGNHGFAVAHAAKKQGIRAIVCVSNRVPPSKIQSLEKSGAALHIEGNSQDEAKEVCERLQKEEGLTLIPPFDHPLIIAGQGTIGLEILESLPEVKHVLSGLSGGGLLSGIGLTMKKTDPSIQVTGLSVEKGAAMDESIKAGKPVHIPEHPTHADSLLGGIGQNNSYTMPMTKQYVDKRLRLSENSIARGMAFLYKEHGLMVEGAAAVGVAALLDRLVTLEGPTVIVLTGQSIDHRSHYEAVKPYL